MREGFSRRRLVMAGLAGAALTLTSVPGPAAGQDVLAELKTEYNDIVVRQNGPLVAMQFKVGTCEFTESVYDTRDPDFLPVAYTRTITAALAYPRQLNSILEIGVGGARTIVYLNRRLPQTRITGVEIDPGVIALARAHFGLVENDRLRVVADDGRRYLERDTERHDLIIVDAYRGTWVPETLTTTEFFELVKSRLAPGGAVAQNVEPTTLFFEGMVATLGAVFDNVDLYETSSGNAVLIAYDGRPKSNRSLARRASELQKRHGFRHPLPQLLQGRSRPPAVGGVTPMRDGFERANTMLMIDRANARDTPRERSARCGLR